MKPLFSQPRIASSLGVNPLSFARIPSTLGIQSNLGVNPTNFADVPSTLGITGNGQNMAGAGLFVNGAPRLVDRNFGNSLPFRQDNGSALIKALSGQP